MIVNADARALEWICIAFLSKDEVAYEEIWNNVDQHTSNQQRFGLPSRLIAKTFVFRLIYGGSAYSYANDPNFMDVSTSEKFWQKVIDEFYDKYKGIGRFHSSIMSEATTTGKLRTPTGRIHNFDSTVRRGDVVWPRTKIFNYPIQGLGADLMCLARVSFARRFKAAGIVGKMISTIHDSIVVDVPESEVERVVKLFISVFDDIPMNFERVFGVKFDLPTRCEVSYGKNKFDLTEWKDSDTIVLSA
jgi:DNA polymerase I-like protein with 3'-5' exonuclease and polymerase domains